MGGTQATKKRGLKRRREEVQKRGSGKLKCKGSEIKRGLRRNL
jgi:hypothetical protein